MTRKELVDLCKQGDRQALSQLYRTYADKMRRICLRYVSDRQTADDLLHDGFIVIITSIHSLRSPEKLESWMGVIMKNISLKYLEQRCSVKSVPVDNIEEGEEPADTAEPDGFPSYQVMLDMIESLPAGYSEVFKLSVLKGLSHKEIGLLLNIAPHSSSSQLSRAKDMLRKFLSRYYTVLLLVGILLIGLRSVFYYHKRVTVTPENKIFEAGGTIDEEGAGITDSLKNLVPSPYRDEIGRLGIGQSADLSGIRFLHKDSVPDNTRDSVIHLHTGYVANNRKTEKSGQNHTFCKSGSWELSLTYSGAINGGKSRISAVPGDISSGDLAFKEEKIHHYMPVTVALSLRKKLDGKWGLETGVQYTFLRSDFTVKDACLTEGMLKVNYVGIPFKVSREVWDTSRFSVYVSGGITMDIPVKVTSETRTFVQGQSVQIVNRNLYPSLQWSVNGGVGLQYQVTPSLGIYVEPNLHYYFNGNNGLNTIRKEHPLDLTFPIGIRFSW